VTVVRAELVRTIIETLGSRDLDSYERACDEASPEEMSAAAHELAQAAVRHAAATVTALDLSMRQLSALGAVWSVVSKWNYSADPDRRLGAMLKIMPPEHAAAVEQALVWGGMAKLVDDDDSDTPP
jgi:histidinol dehydrogenase